jgi:molybdopterin/thiamine biosynthesis adenylyltransferase
MRAERRMTQHRPVDIEGAQGANLGRVALVLTEAHHGELARAATEPLESAGVLLCSVLAALPLPASRSSASPKAGRSLSSTSEAQRVVPDGPILPRSVTAASQPASSPSHEARGEPPEGRRALHGTRLLVEAVRWVPPEGYTRREHDGLTVSSIGYVAALNEAEAQGLTPLWFHTHPGPTASPRASRHDLRVDHELADTFRIRSGAALYGSLIFSPRPGLVAFTGQVADEHATTRINRMMVVGDAIAVRTAADAEPVTVTHPGRMRLPAACPRGDVPPEADLHDTNRRDHDPIGAEEPDLFSRNVKAFGGAVQAALATIAVGVVGCGGTGSAVAEQLVRLGVRDLVLIDPDVLEASNLTRVYGSTSTDVEAPKSSNLATYLTRVAPDLAVDPIIGTINQEAVARRLVDRDVIFGCTDDNSGRMVLSRLAALLRIVTIDCGVLLSSTPGGTLQGIDGRVTIMKPGAACLLCRRRVDTTRAAAELMTPHERGRLAAEGYAPAMPGIEPAVVAYTTMVAAYAVAELIELLTGYGPTPRPTELLLRAHDREVSTNTISPIPGHFCDPAAHRPGAGTRHPFLDKAWTR